MEDVADRHDILEKETTENLTHASVAVISPTAFFKMTRLEGRECFRERDEFRYSRHHQDELDKEKISISEALVQDVGYLLAQGYTEYDRLR